MKILINEKTDEKLFKTYQRLIDKELQEIKDRYREEELGASNWYLSTYSKIDSVEVTKITYLQGLRVYIIVFCENPRFDEDDVQGFASYLREKLRYAGKPWIVPILISDKKEYDENSNN
jgi:hypothetical protein